MYKLKYCFTVRCGNLETQDCGEHRGHAHVHYMHVLYSAMYKIKNTYFVVT